MAHVGMDVEQVLSLAGQLNHQAEAIGQTIQTIDSLVGQLEGAWQGADAKQFAEWWNTQHKPALHNAQQAVAGLAQSATNNAHAQAETSSR